MKAVIEVEGHIELTMTDKPLKAINPHDYVLHEGELKKVSGRQRSWQITHPPTGDPFNWRFTFSDTTEVRFIQEDGHLFTMKVIEARIVS